MLSDDVILKLATNIIKHVDQMSGSGASVLERELAVMEVIVRTLDKSQNCEVITASDVGELPTDLGISVSEQITAKSVFG